MASPCSPPCCGAAAVGTSRHARTERSAAARRRVYGRRVDLQACSRRPDALGGGWLSGFPSCQAAAGVGTKIYAFISIMPVAKGASAMTYRLEHLPTDPSSVPRRGTRLRVDGLSPRGGSASAQSAVEYARSVSVRPAGHEGIAGRFPVVLQAVRLRVPRRPIHFSSRILSAHAPPELLIRVRRTRPVYVTK